MSKKDANAQQAPLSEQEGPMFLEDDGSPVELPTFRCFTNPYRLRLGETIEEAIGRRSREHA